MSLYARVSSDKQKQEQTIESQVAELKQQIAAGHTTFGYRYMRKTTERAAHLLIDEEQAAVIRSVFEMFASGHHSLNAIRASGT
jgi:predicted site-specific integrase-resolvase